MSLPRLLVTRNQLAEILGGVSADTVARWVREGKIPGPWNGTTRWDLIAVEHAIARSSRRRPALDAATRSADDPVARDAAELDRIFGR